MNELMLGALNAANHNWSDFNVQEHWNVLENLIINTVDKLAPLEVYSPLHNKVKSTPPKNVKNLINVRKRLLKNDCDNKTCSNAPRI